VTNGAPPAPGGAGNGSGNHVERQITDWWQEVETAVRHSHSARARRFLRWIVTCHPEEEEAWLALAHLARTPEERLQTLYQAYTLHPGSLRVVSRLSEARTEFLESTVGDLVRPRNLIRCLPDERRLPHSNNSASHNGNGSHPLDEIVHTPGLLARLLHAISDTL
jgi:hypothetical protein